MTMWFLNGESFHDYVNCHCIKAACWQVLRCFKKNWVIWTNMICSKSKMEMDCGNVFSIGKSTFSIVGR